MPLVYIQCDTLLSLQSSVFRLPSSKFQLHYFVPAVDIGPQYLIRQRPYQTEFFMMMRLRCMGGGNPLEHECRYHIHPLTHSKVWKSRERERERKNGKLNRMTNGALRQRWHKIIQTRAVKKMNEDDSSAHLNLYTNNSR